MNRVRALTLLTICFLLPACGDTPSGLGDADDLLTPTTEDLYTVGAYSGEDWETLGTVAGVAFDDAGNLHILDRDAKRIVVVDREGNLVRTVGRQGGGPGEFSDPWGFGIMRDGRIVVNDFLAGLHVFDSEGEFAEVVTLSPFDGLPGQMMLPVSDMNFVSRGGMRATRPGEESEDDHLRDIDLFALDGSAKQVLYRAWNLPPTPEDEEVVSENEEGQRQMSFSLGRMRAFEPGLHLGVLSDGRLAVADSMGYRVKLIGMDGTVSAVLERQVDPEPVTGAVMEAERERRTEAFSGNANVEFSGPAGLLEPGMLEELLATQAAQVEDMVFTDVIPVIANLAVDPTDMIWIARTGKGAGGPGPIDLLLSDGSYLGTLPADGLAIPDAFGPDGMMAYVETDELDVPVVRVIRLVSFAIN
ncbi:MAG: hypothetical protein F4187_08845 [Gemmatimonadetes bacterium]|nr:hypothetical protein [Gemmatimonadota bacterium]